MSSEQDMKTKREWPDLLGEFRVHEVLGEGPWATSLRVTMIGDPEKRGDMVLKVFHHVDGPAWKAIGRVDDSVIKALGSETHLNVAHTYEVGQFLDDIYVLQEYVDGIDLRTLLTMFPEPLGEFPSKAAEGIAVQLSAAIEHIHGIRLGEKKRTRVVHGDLYPGNVMIARDGRVKLLDTGFGAVARQVGRTGVDGGTVGSPGYLAPEQLAEKPPTPSTDVFAFGALLGEMFLGEPLFRGETANAVLDQVKRCDLDDEVARLKEIHATCSRIVKRTVTPGRKGRLSDGVLLVGEMFGSGMTDDGMLALKELVAEALEIKKEMLPLPPRNLVATSGSVVDVYVSAAAGEDVYPAYEEASEDSLVSVEFRLGPEPEPTKDLHDEESFSEDLPPPPPTEEEAAAAAEADEFEEVDERGEGDDEPGDRPPPPPPEAKDHWAEAAAGPPPAAEPVSAKAEPAPAPEKKGGGRTLLYMAAAAVIALVCGGVGAAAVYQFVIIPGQQVDPATGGPTDGGPIATNPVDPPPVDKDALAEADDDSAQADDDSAAADDALAEEETPEEETPEEPTPEMTEEERQRWLEQEEERRLKREEEKKKREEERKKKEEERKKAEAEAMFDEREEELEDAKDDVDWGFGDKDDEEDDWLSDDGSASGDDKIKIDLDSLTSSVPDVGSAADKDPPKVRHTPVRSGKVGNTVTLRQNVTPSDSYTGVLYFRGSPGGTWDSKNISGGDNGKIIVKLSLGSWVSDDHDSVEYYFLVDGPGGSSGAGTRLSPYTMALK